MEFRYENLPLFYFYCGCVGYNEKGCARRRMDVAQNNVLQDQFGYWIRAGFRRGEGMSSRQSTERQDKENQLNKSAEIQIGGNYVAENDKLRKLEKMKTGTIGEQTVLIENGEGRVVAEEERIMVVNVVIGKEELSRRREVRHAVCKEGQQELRQEGITHAKEYK